VVCSLPLHNKQSHGMLQTVRISILKTCGGPFGFLFVTSILVTVLQRYGAWTRVWRYSEFL